MESRNERQNPSESMVDSDYHSMIAGSKPRDKDSLVGPFGDSPNKNDRQRRKLLNWLKETQQKREENNKRIFCRWLGMVEKGNVATEAKPQVVASPKSETTAVKTEYPAAATPKVHSIPYDAFYAMTPVYYTYSAPDYYMMGPEQQNVPYYNNYVQRTPCSCYPYCYQTPTSTLPSREMQMSATGPPMPPPPPPPPPLPSSMGVLPKEPSPKPEPLQFNLSEWYSSLEDTDGDGGQLLDNLQANDNQQGQPSLDFASIAASNSGPVSYSVSSLVSVTSSQPGDFS